MKINGNKLRRLMDASGVTVERLGSALAGRGMNEATASSAVNNWLLNRNHPRVRPAQVGVIARELGARPTEFCTFVSTARWVRGSERKARLVSDMIRGMPVEKALATLQFTNKRAATPVRKTLLAAIADAERAEADVGALVVAESRVDGGPQMKRFQPKDRGRAHQILKRMSHIVVGVEER